jgi:sodium/bile acid cotransporter 7
VVAAICSASLSSLVGIALTPLLVWLTMGTGGSGMSGDSIVDLVLQLLLPFVLGQISRRWIGSWAAQHSKALGRYDRSTIVLIVYSAFSQGVAQGIWHQIAPIQLAWLALIEGALLAFVLTATHLVSRVLGFSHADQSAIVFCGSKKSLASGLPMANVIFAGTGIGLIVLPVMLFHQMQLIVCAMIARRRAVDTTESSRDERTPEPV